jgi:hypothetical protein
MSGSDTLLRPLAPRRPLARPTTALAASVPEYPLQFPIPDRQPYAYQVDMGVVRSEMAAGNSRQRRAFTIMPHALGLSFHLRIEELYFWQSWVNAYAYSWFLCPVSTMYAGGPPEPENLRLEVLRFTGNLDVQMEGWDWVAVSVPAELSSDAQAMQPPGGLGGWIVGGTPAAPSPDWVLAGTPAAPSPDWVLSGTPEFPAAVE